MPRKARQSGHHVVSNAREMFEQSVKNGQPDYRFVALAIGAAPIAPPRWAVWACIEEKEREERKPASFADIDLIGKVLDELVRFYDREQQKRRAFAETEDGKPPALRAALICVYGLLGIEHGGSGADDSWLRTARRAWEREQAKDRVASSFELDGWHITGRIDRILTAAIGREFGLPTDPVKHAWLLEQGEVAGDTSST